MEIARELFAERGFEGTSVEEIAARAGVSKPVVYEHFGGKEGAYAVVVDRETQILHGEIRAALTTPNAGARELLERGAMALLEYIERCPDGFRILSRDSSVGQPSGSFASILSDIAVQVEDLLGAQFQRTGHDPKLARLYAQALVGLVAQTGQQWLDNREPSREVVARHLINLAWNGMAHLKPEPRLIIETIDKRLSAADQADPSSSRLWAVGHPAAVVVGPVSEQTSPTSTSDTSAASTSPRPWSVNPTSTPRPSDVSGSRVTAPLATNLSTRLVIVPDVTWVSFSNWPGVSWYGDPARRSAARTSNSHPSIPWSLKACLR